MLTDPAYRTLAALQDGPLHGYAIARRVREQSGDSVRLTAGTLYGVLERLKEAGLVVAGPEEIVDGRARRQYRLSDEGRDALYTEAWRLRAAARLVSLPEPRPA